MKKLFVYLIIIGSAIGAGAPLGFFGKKLFGPKDIDYSNIDFDSLKADVDEIIKKIDGYNGGQDKTDVFSTGEILNYSLEKFRRCENCALFQFGVADTIVKQDIRGAVIKNGNKFFEESVSQSKMVSLGNRMYQTDVGGDIKLYSANKGSINITDNQGKGTYSEGNVKNYTGEAYKNDFGKTLDEIFIYLVSDETINTSTTTKTDSGYVIDTSLDPNLSTNGYKHQMKSISGLDKLPSFSKVNLKFTLDKNLILKKISTDEQYVATMTVDANTHGTMDMYCFADEYIKIPEINEGLIYKKGE